MEWLQNMLVVWGVIIIFIIILYYRYPKLSSGLKKIFKIISRNKSKKDSIRYKDKVKYTDEEMIDIIQGSIKRYHKKEDYTAKQCIKRIKEIVD